MAKKLKIEVTDVRRLHESFKTYEDDGTPVANIEALENWHKEHPTHSILGARFFDEEFEAVVKEKIKAKKKPVLAEAEEEKPKAEAKPKKKDKKK